MPRRVTIEHGPHPLDIALGIRVRLRRKELGLSQQDLAQACGVSFQQMQKYEHGANRISFSRLVEISRALNCSALDLIGNLSTSKTSKIFHKQLAHLAEPGATDLMSAYATINSPKQRQALIGMARQMAHESAPSKSTSRKRGTVARRAS